MLNKLQNLSDGKKKGIIIAVVVIAGLAMGGAWLVSAGNRIPAMANVFQTLNLPQINLPELPEENLPAIAEDPDWKTYSNTKYGFEIVYPSDFSTLEYNGGGNTWTVEFSPEQNTGSPSFASVLIGESVKIPPGVAQVQVNNYKAWQFIKEGSNKEYVTIFQRDSDQLLISFAYSQSPTGGDYKEEYEVMLSTFKFTNTTN
ncbi:hypothetical protein KW786_01555 [Candidatus Parcubacteria bacterium]|nr:hypothetical protein [Candidatus Parcubacteria bacterium]